MTNFNDLSDLDVLELDDSQTNLYIDLACAEAGVPLLPPRPTEPIGPPVTADVTVYQVGDLYFYDQADALRASEILGSMRRCSLQYVSGPRYERVVRPDNGDVSVTAVRHFSPEHWDRVKNDANRYAEAKKTYDTNIVEYNKASEGRDRIAQFINERRELVRSREARRVTLRANFARYLTLADGNQQIAARFLENACHDAPDLLPELFIVAETS